MELKKILAGFLSATIITFSSGTAFALYREDLTSQNEAGQIIPIKAKLDEQEQIHYKSFTGTVKEIRDLEGVEGSKFVLLEDEEGLPANIIISKDACVLDNAEITVGSTITGYYDANKPMIMIYPPQYSAEVVVVESENQNVKFDIFNEDLVSADKSLKLNMSDDTEIILQDGTVFEGEVANRRLIVIYGISTKSIPAQTTPDKIVVLLEKAEEMPIFDVSTMEIVVNKEVIQAPAAYTSEKGTVMVPLRAIAEALGYKVTWNNETLSVTLDKDISLTIGEDNYISGDNAPIKLGTAPELTGERTFVPLNFFKQAVKMNNAHVFEAQIVIDNGEVME